MTISQFSMVIALVYVPLGNNMIEPTTPWSSKISFPLKTLGTTRHIVNSSFLSKFMILDFLNNFTISGLCAPLLPATRRRCHCLLATLYCATDYGHSMKT